MTLLIQVHGGRVAANFIFVGQSFPITFGCREAMVPLEPSQQVWISSSHDIRHQSGLFEPPAGEERCSNPSPRRLPTAQGVTRPNSTHTGVGFCVTWPVGVSLPVDWSTAKATMLSEPWLAA